MSYYCGYLYYDDVNFLLRSGDDKHLNLEAEMPQKTIDSAFSPSVEALDRCLSILAYYSVAQLYEMAHDHSYSVETM
jgi:hypothetical protein